MVKNKLKKHIYTKMLEENRWHEDMVITNYDGIRVWLKKCIHNGRCVGITDCCEEQTPCKRHKNFYNTHKEMVK